MTPKKSAKCKKREGTPDERAVSRNGQLLSPTGSASSGGGPILPSLVMDEWDQRISAAYAVVEDDYWDEIERKGESRWNATVRAVAGTSKQAQVYGDEEPVEFILPQEIVSRKDHPKKAVAFLQTISGASSQYIRIANLPNIKPPPGMQYWAQTERNILVEDEHVLSHIPYIEDVDDDNFGAELAKTYEEGIHGSVPGILHEKLLNDKMLYNLITELHKRYGNEILDDKNNLLEPAAVAIHRSLPDKLPVKQLVNFRREDGSILPNVDGPDVQLTTADRTLHTYTSLFCRRCCVYDCLLHGISETHVPRKRAKLDRSTLKPCHSPSCYLLDKDLFVQPSLGNVSPGMTRRSSPKKVQSPSTNKQISITISDNWSTREKTMFNVLRRTYNDDYCKVANALSMVCGRTILCDEVCSYARSCGPSSPMGKQDYIQTPEQARKRKGTFSGDEHRRFRALKWGSQEQAGKVKNTHTYVPCYHPGVQCKEATVDQCTCKRGNLCTKWCRCSAECDNRFPGCRCSENMCRTKSCQCYYANWECDPDRCGCHTKCKEPDAVIEPRCKNVNILFGKQARLLVAKSDVAGWGCFAQDPIEKNDFVSEYCGEVITQEESERRGKVYDKQRCSYLFGLTSETVVDATRKGNLIRFANHSVRPNCRAKVLVVGGDHRIGIFADRRIEAGEELFFDYSYNKVQQVQFVSKELKRSAMAQKAGTSTKATAANANQTP